MATIDDAALALVCEDVAAGEAIRSVIRRRKVSKRGFYERIATDSTARERYARAKQVSTEAMADEILRLADDCKPEKNAVAKARLQIDSRKWLLAKLEPKKYGESTTLRNDPDNPIPPLVVIQPRESTGND